MEETAPNLNSQRFVFIDALRGLAALAVLLHHVLNNSVMEESLRRVLPGFLVLLSDCGLYGVQVFFVLSGFVIAHALRDNPLTLKSIGNFILRRQVRLDPPYWLVLIMSLGLHHLELALPFLVTTPMPRFNEAVLNFFYLQNLARVEQIVVVSWTLCLEIQFYLVFILLLALGSCLAQTRKFQAAGFLVFALGLVSLAMTQKLGYEAWFTSHWFHFAAGALGYWAVWRLVNRWLFWSFVVCFACATVVAFQTQGKQGDPHLGASMVVGLSTVLMLYVAGIKGALTTLGNHRVLQYFGRISYSLYLVHLPVLLIVLKTGYKLTGENPNIALLWFVAALLICIGAAHLLFIAVERPCMRFASKLKLRP